MAKYKPRVICPHCKEEAVSIERGLGDELHPFNNPNSIRCDECGEYILVSTLFKVEKYSTNETAQN